jgi:hypothetical protein
MQQLTNVSIFARRRRWGLSLLMAGGAWLMAATASSWGVEMTGNTFNTTAPTSANIPNWNTGWGSSTVSGWNYVGVVNGATGVYLGNGWAMTVGHVGNGSLTLGGTTYPLLQGSLHTFTNPDGSDIDLCVFKLSVSPSLPALSISGVDPVAFSQNQAGSGVAMIGFAGGKGETWGYNAVTEVNSLQQVSFYTSNDFETDLGKTTAGTSSVTNNAFLVSGDSGGGDFIFNSATQSWTLAGLNEAIDDSNNSYLVQLDTYAPQISAITGLTSLPEPSSTGLLGFGLLMWLGRFRAVSCVPAWR